METPLIAITGGPCAGKTSILTFLVENLLEKGFTPLICPESATTLIQSQVFPSNQDFQKYLYQTQKYFENMMLNVSQSFDKPVILCDRGVLDALAYIDKNKFSEIIDPLTISFLRNSNYKAVIHLETAAIDAEEFYTLENNSARSETLEQARIIDQKLVQAYNGVSKHILIKNRGIDFFQKKQKALSAVLDTLGYPMPIEDEKKFLIYSSFRPEDIPSSIHTVKTPIVQDYISVDEFGTEERIRKKGKKGSEVYFYTKKINIKESDARIEEEKIISKSEYKKLLSLKDLQTFPYRIIKDRYTFHYKGFYFELDFFQFPKKLVILEIEKTSISEDEIEIPDFLLDFVIQEVTSDPEYRNASLAKG